MEYLSICPLAVHFYDYMKDAWDPEIYPRPRFASEYGFQSLPGSVAWQRVLHEGDNLSELISHRQHHPLAMIPVTTLIHRHLPLPLPESENYNEALIYFSQIAQAMATKVETELYRSLRDTNHNTMGALYWQLNDVWVAPSWSSIDFYGNWKVGDQADHKDFSHFPSLSLLFSCFTIGHVTSSHPLPSSRSMTNPRSL